jgi:hypothetical protein
MRNVLAGCIALGLIACKADIPDGVFACDMKHACPSGFVCRPRSTDSMRFCFSEDAAPDGGGTGGETGNGSVHDGGATDDGGRGDAGLDAGTGTPTESGFTVQGAGFWSVGEQRNAGRYVVHDDGFDRGQRLCTADRELCMTGGFSP